jgi:hypothetical protein
MLLGDKSAVDVVAHEIAHSWMGNLVTTQNWEHFWVSRVQMVITAGVALTDSISLL